MPDPQEISRRTLIKSAGCGVGLAATTRGVAAGAEPASDASRRQPIAWQNADFYDDQGAFRADQAKAAVLELCAYHHYPVFPGLADGLWVWDYNIGQFATLGLAAYIFVNNVSDRYMMLDLFLLPGQMVPEHWHVAAEGNPAKLEGWLVRWGISHIVGVGEANLSATTMVPDCHWGGKTTARHEIVGTAGTFVPLAKVESPHWQLGGPEGAIVTEVANVHTNSGVRHSDPVLNANFLASL